MALLLVLVLVAGLGVGFALYHRQVVSYLTHRKDGPSTTWAYVAHDPPAAFHLAAAGDVGDSGSRIDATGAAVARIGAIEPYDALLLLGDNVYPTGNPANLPGTVFEPFSEVLDSGTVLLAILGNHDVKDGWGDAQMEALGMSGRFWAEEYDDVLIVGLDSNEVADPEQLAFLEDSLASTSAGWKIVALHHPPYSAGYQGSSINVRQALSPLFEQYGVQLVLSGHDHDYQRSVPIGGVTYVVSGAGAGTRRTGADAFTAASYSWHNFLDIAITGDRLMLRAIGQDGSVFDEVVMDA
ncbi:MAG TPA: metallophosphoesterase [Ilumatobacteraceae bacterium]|nr:metallophosphoesterase [Ilumatobacteraceae bacterium]